MRSCPQDFKNVRANACSHTATIGSLIIETTMNKGIQTNC